MSGSCGSSACSGTAKADRGSRQGSFPVLWRGRPLRHLLLVVLAVALWACSGDGGYLSGSGAAGFRAHRSDWGGGYHAIVSGIVEVDMQAGCVWLSLSGGNRYPVIWPVGTSARSGPFEITVGKRQAIGEGQVVRPGDFVEGGGGYLQADSAPQRYGLEPFPTECLQGSEAAVFNPGSPIDITPGVGLELVETLAGRFPLPESMGLDLIAVDPDTPSVAVINLSFGTVHQYEPGRYHGPKDTIDGASTRGWFIHLWSQGTIYSYLYSHGRLDSEPMVYKPDPLSRTPAAASTLVVLPAPDSEHTWLVQPGVANDVTLVELVNLVGMRVNRLMSTSVEGKWQPVGVTIEGLVLVTDGPEPITRLISPDGMVRAEVEGTALSVGRNGAAVLRPDRSLITTDARLDNPTQVDKPGTGEWMPVSGPLASTTTPLTITTSDQFLVMLASEPEKGPSSAGELMVIDPSGYAIPIYEVSRGPHLASWSRGGDWVVVVEDSTVTLVNLEDGSIEPLGALVPDSHRVLTAG